MASNTTLTRAVRLALVAAAVYGTAAVAQETEIEQIVVTGSRISRPDLQEASPIQSIGAEEIALQGTSNVENILNTLPQVVGASTQTSNNPGGGIATVNLRNIGTQRTLVLVDGRRYISYDTDQVVDLNTIPTALIERIDVVTGGRSAVYGSDAMAGVVNFIMKKNFEGAELDTGLRDQRPGRRRPPAHLGHDRRQLRRRQGQRRAVRRLDASRCGVRGRAQLHQARAAGVQRFGTAT